MGASNNKAQWLIKSNSLLLGPLSTGELQQLLQEHKVSVYDDAILPCGRWQHIKLYSELEPLSAPAPAPPPPSSHKLSPMWRKKFFALKVGCLLLACVVGAGVFSWWQNYHQSSHVRNFKKQAFLYLAAGHQKQALKMLQNLHTQNPSDTSLYLRLGLLLQKNGHKEQGQRLLNKLHVIQGPASSESLMALGLADLQAERYQEAQKKFSKIKLKNKSLYLDAQINQGFVYFLQNKFQQAAEVFQRAAEQKPKAFLMQIYAMLKAPIVPTTVLENFAAQIKTKHLFNYRQELLFLNLYLQHRLQKTIDPARVAEALNTDPYQSDQHAQSLFVYTNFNWWQSFLPLCQELTNNDKFNSMLLKALCLAKVQALDVALKTLERALAQQAQSAQALALKAYVLDLKGQKTQATKWARQAVQHNKGQQLLPLLMQAHLCPASACLKLWKSILEQQPQQLAALAYLARTQKTYLPQGLKLSENYKPFLEHIFIR